LNGQIDQVRPVSAQFQDSLQMGRKCVGDISALQPEDCSLSIRLDDLIGRVSQRVFI